MLIRNQIDKKWSVETELASPVEKIRAGEMLKRRTMLLNGNPLPACNQSLDKQNGLDTWRNEQCHYSTTEPITIRLKD